MALPFVGLAFRRTGGKPGWLKKPENVASSFDRLRMRSCVFNELTLMVSLSNHGQHRFSAASKSLSAFMESKAGYKFLFYCAPYRKTASHFPDALQPLMLTLPRRLDLVAQHFEFQPAVFRLGQFALHLDESGACLLEGLAVFRVKRGIRERRLE